MQNCTLSSEKTPSETSSKTSAENSADRFDSTRKMAASRQASTLSVGDLSYFADGWLLDCEIRKHSPQTVALRRLITYNTAYSLAQQVRVLCHEIAHSLLWPLVPGYLFGEYTRARYNDDPEDLRHCIASMVEEMFFPVKRVRRRSVQ